MAIVSKIDYSGFGKLVRQPQGASMLGHRAYVLGPDGRITRREDYYARNDDLAVEHARQWVSELDVEVWSEDNRKLLVLKPE